MKKLWNKIRNAFAIHIVSKSFFCRHKWVDFKIRNFDEPKMDSKGRLTTKMLLRKCGKCDKIECFAMN